MWDKSLSGGLSSIQGKVVSLEDYFSVIPIGDNGNFVWEKITFDVVQSVHIMNGFTIVPSYGLMIHAFDSRKIYFTSDAQFNPNQIKDFYRLADIIIQDCETTPFKSGVHAHYQELKTLDKKIKNKMWLWHYSDNMIKDFHKNNETAKKDGFLGFLHPSEEIPLK
jgi:hypothetical protein